MPRGRSAAKRQKKSRKRGKGSKRRKLKRRLKTDAMTHAKRRHARTRGHRHKARMYHEVQTVNRLLSHLLKTASSTENKPYNFDRRHHTKDPEYAWSDERTKQFKRGFPAPDVNMLRPQGETLPPHHGNFPNWYELAD